MRKRLYLVLIVLAILLLALGGLVARSAFTMRSYSERAVSSGPMSIASCATMSPASGSRPAPDAPRPASRFESDTLKSMGCNVARFARAGEEKGEGTCPTRSCWVWCPPWRA